MDDDDDVDIDSLLQACDNLVDVPKTSSAGSIKQPLKSNLKETAPGDFRSSAPVSTKKERQSVRFSNEVEESNNVPNRTELADILLQDDPAWRNQVNYAEDRRSTHKNQEPPSTDFSTAPIKRSSSASAKDDWLGLDENDFDSPYTSLDMFPVGSGSGPLIRNFDAGDSYQKESNFEEAPEIDTSDLLKMLASGKKGDVKAKKPPIPPNSGRKNLESLGNSRSQSPISASSQRGLQSEAQTSIRNPSFPIRDSSPDQFSRIGDQQPRQTGQTIPFNQIPVQQAPLPQLQSSSNINMDAPKTGSSFLESLPFLNKPKDISGKKNLVESETAGGDLGDPNPGVPSEKSVKKKVSGTKLSGGAGSATLQLPSHLVNEDELKVMSSSLKTLYANQLEMLENSYKEQLEFLSLSNKRREDLLKDEMSNLQEDYEQRLKRMRAELVKNDGLSVERVHEDMTKLSDLVSKLGTKLETAQSIDNNLSLDELKSDLLKEFRKLLSGHNEDNLTRIGSSLEQQVQKSFQEVMQRANSIQSVQLEELKKRLESLVGNKELWNDKILDKIEISEKTRQEELQRVLKVQRKISEAGVNSVVESILKLFENQKDASKKKGDRLAVQIKEFRKDLRRLYADLETRSDSVHKSQFSIEMEQRTITQAVRDINTILKLVTSSNQRSQFFGGDINDTNSHYSLIQATQLQTQNEMEMKLMKEERRALSDSIAQMNVERRKLGDERVALERERLEFEKEKSRVRELEMQAKSRMMEAEELKRNAESLRLRESQLTQEAEIKMKEANKEKSRMKERYFEIEQTLRMKEQKLYQDKCDLLKEKEFMDKLRDQLLCPGCLNTSKCVSSSALLHLSAPPSYNSMRSDGDGVELMNDTNLLTTVPVPKLTLSPQEDAFFRSRNKLLLQQIQSQAFTEL